MAMNNEQIKVILSQMQQQNALIMAMLQTQQEPEPEQKPVHMENITAAGKRYGLSYGFIRGLCADNKIAYVRSGRRTFINMESLEAYLRRGEGGDVG